MYWLLFILWGFDAIVWVISDRLDPHWTHKLWAILATINSVLNLLMAISC